MTKITDITKTNLTTEIRPEIQAKLDELKDIGLVVKLEGITYGDNYFTAKISAHLESGITKDAEMLTKYFPEKEYMVDDIIATPSGYKRIIGYRPSRRKYGLVVKIVKKKGNEFVQDTVFHEDRLHLTYKNQNRDNWTVVARKVNGEYIHF